MVRQLIANQYIPKGMTGFDSQAFRQLLVDISSVSVYKKYIKTKDFVMNLWHKFTDMVVSDLYCKEERALMAAEAERIRLATAFQKARIEEMVERRNALTPDRKKMRLIATVRYAHKRKDSPGPRMDVVSVIKLSENDYKQRQFNIDTLSLAATYFHYSVPQPIADCANGIPDTIFDYGDDTFTLISIMIDEHGYDFLKKFIPVSEWWDKYSHYWLKEQERQRMLLEREQGNLREELKSEEMLKEIYSKLNIEEQKFLSKYLYNYVGPTACV